MGRFNFIILTKEEIAANATCSFTNNLIIYRSNVRGVGIKTYRYYGKQIFIIKHNNTPLIVTLNGVKQFSNLRNSSFSQK